MKKNLTILTAVLITLFSLNVKAQDDNPQAKSYMAFFGGISHPLGSYGSTDYSNNNSGYAKNGPTLGFDWGIYLHKNLGIGITFSYQDQGELSAEDAQNLATGYLASFDKNESNVTSQGRYQTAILMAGPNIHSCIKDLRLISGLRQDS